MSLWDWLIIGIPAVIVFTVAVVMKKYLRSVADFLAASRCAGRYLICTAGAETGAAITGTITNLEVFSRTGFSFGLWGAFTSFVFFMLTLFGFVGYRFRETRCLTFHQFFEMRYSKGLRVFASFINFFSGLFNFGILPALGARFFVYFCGLPHTLPVGSYEIPTYTVVMVLLLAASVFLALTGGQISVMVTDCLEGLLSSLFYVIIAVAILLTLSYSQMQTAMLSGPPGQSYVDPFDIGKRGDFNGWYLVVGFFLQLSYYRGNAWNQGFAAAAKNAHEGRMASILGQWRAFGGAAMGTLVAVGAFTLLHNPDFSAQAAQVEERLSVIKETQIQTQMRMPVALSVLLPTGIKGMFCAIGFFGLLAGLGSQMHGFGSTFIQDVLLPLRKKHLDPKQHILWLRCAAIGVGAFAICFGTLFKPPEYLVMIIILIGSMYLGGVGSVVLGGLYWKKGTMQGAWASMIVGFTTACIGLVLQNGWKYVDPWLISVFQKAGWLDWAKFLIEHPEKCPINGQYLAGIAAALSLISYVSVSLLTCRVPFDMDKLLHRGKYKVDELDSVGEKVGARSKLGALIGIDENYTRGDKWIAGSIFWWSVFWKVVAVVVVVWNVWFWRWPAEWWFAWSYFQGVYVVLAIGICTTIWFTIGTVRDLIALFRSLRTVARDERDDGTVDTSQGEPAPAKEKEVLPVSK